MGSTDALQSWGVVKAVLVRTEARGPRVLRAVEGLSRPSAEFCFGLLDAKGSSHLQTNLHSLSLLWMKASGLWLPFICCRHSQWILSWLALKMTQSLNIHFYLGFSKRLRGE